MKNEYLAAQRKALYSVIVDRQFQFMLEYSRKYFADKILGQIYDSVLACVSASIPISKESVMDRIASTSANKLSKDLAIATVASLVSKKEVYSSNLPFFLAEQYRVWACDELVAKLSDPNVTDKGRALAIDEAQTAMLDNMADDEATPIKDIIQAYFDDLESGVPTKFKQRSIPIVYNKPLGDMFCGYIYPAPYCIAAAPGFGKTRIASNLVDEFIAQRSPGIIYTYEDSKQTAVHKFLSARYTKSYRDMAMGNLPKEDLEGMRQREYGKDWQALVVDKQMGIDDWMLHARRMFMTRDIRWVIVDFMQAFTYDRRHEVAEINRITKGIRELSKTYTCPIITLSQVNNRETDLQTGEVKLTLGNVKGAGSIEEDNRAVFLIDGQRDGAKRWKAAKYTLGPIYNGEVEFDGPSGRVINFQRISK